MGVISLGPGVETADYYDWLKNSPGGQAYGAGIQRQVGRGMTVSHAPPAGEIMAWKNRGAAPNTQPSQGSPYNSPQQQGSSQRPADSKSSGSVNMSPYAAQPTKAPDMSMYSPGSAQQSPAAAPNRAPAPANPTQMQFANPGQHLSYRAPDISAYSPGRAQPTQTQSQGSPYQTAPQSPNAPQPYQPRGGVQSGGLMADPEETRRIDEIMARNGVSRQDYADPRYQDYLRALRAATSDSTRRIEEFGRYKQTGQTQYQLPPPPANSAQPRPYGNDQYAPPRREREILIDGRSQRGPAPDQQQNPFAGMQPGVYSPTGQFYDGNLAQGLSQAQRQRDAFVMQMNQATLPYQMANVFGADLGAPNYDFQGMLGRANKMVEDGFYNPFTQYFDQDLATQLGQYAPPSMYQTDRGPRGGIYT